MAPGNRTLPQQEKLTTLSSRKLWQLLELNENKILALKKISAPTEKKKSKNKKQSHQTLSKAIRQELMLRNDFDDGDAWKMPH